MFSVVYFKCMCTFKIYMYVYVHVFYLTEDNVYSWFTPELTESMGKVCFKLF